jgi:hypothetical protein
MLLFFLSMIFLVDFLLTINIGNEKCKKII